MGVRRGGWGPEARSGMEALSLAVKAHLRSPGVWWTSQQKGDTGLGRRDQRPGSPCEAPRPWRPAGHHFCAVDGGRVTSLESFLSAKL